VTAVPVDRMRQPGSGPLAGVGDVKNFVSSERWIKDAEVARMAAQAEPQVGVSTLGYFPRHGQWHDRLWSRSV